jgi:hypothetical protein
MDDISKTTDLSVLMNQFPETTVDTFALYQQVQRLEVKAKAFKDALLKHLKVSIPPDQHDEQGHAFGIKDGIKHLLANRATVSWKGVVDEILLLDPSLRNTVDFVIRQKTKVSEQHYIGRAEDIKGVWDAKEQDLPAQGD